MKKIIIKARGQEVASGSLKSPLLLVGRSPHCDIILRTPGAKPVHFLIEWSGEGEFDLKQQQWAIYDISKLPEKTEQSTSAETVGVGLMLSTKSTLLDGFDISISEDKLDATDIEGGIMAKSIREKETTKRVLPNDSTLLEIVSIDLSSNSVKDVKHFEVLSMDGHIAPLPEVPQIKLSWKKNVNSISTNSVDLSLDVSKLQDFEAYSQGKKMPSDFTTLPLHKSTVLRIRWNTFDYYFRAVPRLDVEALPLSIGHDKFYRYSLLAVLFIFSFFWILGKNYQKPIPEIKEPPRIAKIEIKEAAKPKALPEEKESPTVTTPTVDPKIIQQQAQSPHAQNTKQSANTKKVSPQNPVAPVTNVTSVGLLGALSNSTKGKNAKVSADKVFNEGLVTDSISGQSASVIVTQPPAGRIGGKSSDDSGNNGNDLARASSKLNSKDVLNAKSIGPLSNAGRGGEFKFGYEIGGADAPLELVEGGLDKESIRRALAAYRKEIRTCYERALIIKPRISGRVVYNWNINPAGAVTSISLKQSDTGLPKLDSCVLQVIQGIKFPAAPNGQPTRVIYPFEFQSKN